MIGSSPIGFAPMGSAGVESEGPPLFDNGIGDADLSFPPIMLEALGGASATLTLPALTLEAGTEVLGGAELALPALTLSARGGATATVTLPALTATGRSGGSMSQTLPPLRVSSTGRRSASQGAALSLPAAALTSYGGATSGVVLPGLQFSGSATGGAVGRAACVLPALRLSATATNPELARASLSFRPLVARAYGGGTAALTLTPIKGGGTGIVGSVARAALTLPALTVVADATQGSMARATLQLPALRMTPLASAAVKLPALRMSATARASFAVVHEAYAMHMGSRAPDAMANQVTRYTGYPFHVIVRFKGENYGVASDGLYLIGGETDDGASIPWRFESCLTDFGVAQKKNVSSAYFAGRLGANVSVKVLAGDAPDKVYAHTTIPVAHAVNHREKLGRGRVTRYFAFGASGSGDLSLDAMEFEINQATRRI